MPPTQRDPPLNPSLLASVQVLAEQILALKDRAAEDRETLKKDFLTKGEFKPVMLIAYGMTASVLTGVLGAVLAMVLRK